MPLAKPTKPDAITAVPTPVPLRTDRANFAARGDAMMGWFPDGIDEINDTSDYMDDAANFAEQEANEAEASATAAAASNVAAGANAAAAAASAGATVWVTGTTYAAGVVRYSPTNFQTYRDTVGGVSNTDPASDVSGRWISAMLPSVEAIGLPAMPPTAVFNFASGVIDRRFVEQRTTAATRYNIFGNLETLAAGVAKPTYDPETNACEGYLAEPAATYLAMRSTEMDNASYWAPGNITVTPDAAIGIDGEMSMFKIEATATTTGTILSRAHAATAAQQYYTIRAKKGTGATVGNRFGAYNATTATSLSFFTIDYDTGVVTHSVGSGATATPVGHDGVWEIRVPVTSGVTALDSLSFYACFTGSTATAGDHAYVGFPDVADKPNLTHIPTAGGNVTTVGGGLTLDLTAHDEIVNPAGFTLVCAFDGTHPATSGADEILFSVGSSASNVIYLNLTAAGNFLLVCNVGGVSEIVSVIGPILAGRNRFAVSIQAGACIAVANGGAVVSMGTLSAIPSLTSLVVGTYPYVGAFQVSAPIEHIVPFPRACTAGELTALVNNF